MYQKAQFTYQIQMFHLCVLPLVVAVLTKVQDVSKWKHHYNMQETPNQSFFSPPLNLYAYIVCIYKVQKNRTILIHWKLLVLFCSTI